MEFTFEHIFYKGMLVWILPEPAFNVEHIKQGRVVSGVDKVADLSETKVGDGTRSFCRGIVHLHVHRRDPT